MYDLVPLTSTLDLYRFYSLAKEKSRVLSLALEVFDDGGWGSFAETI